MNAELKRLHRALARSAKNESEIVRQRVSIISVNLKTLEKRPDDIGLRRVIVSQIDELMPLVCR